MAQIHGDIGGGKFGVMSSSQALDWLVGKLPHKPSAKYKSNLQSCLNDVTSNRGKDTGGRVHGGDKVQHTSAGKAGQKDGATIFYCIRGGHVAKIVGLGSHTGSSSYDVYWKDGNWVQGKSLSL